MRQDHSCSPLTSSAGIEAYASLIASTLAAFPGDTQFVFFDDPSEEYLSLPLLPQQHRRKLKQLDKDKKGSPEKTAAASTVPEGRTMELQAAVDYFCDGIGEVQAEGGTEDVLWYRMVIRRGSAELPGPEVPSTWDGLDRRYAVYRGEDEVGYSGRERWSVRFS